jgi:benzodiazapine receptor
VPAWLLILIVMAAVILGMNPTARDFAWFQQLRRPVWFSSPGWIPLIWLTINISLYASALLAWQARRDWMLIVAYLLLLVLVQGYTWLMCRTRQLATGAVIGLIGWGYALLFSVHLHSVSPNSVLLLLPYLIWSPIQAFATWQMRSLSRR